MPHCTLLVLTISLFLLLLTACSVASDSPGAGQSANTGKSGPPAWATTSASGECRDAEYVRKMKADYRANYLRAHKTYQPGPLCLRGTVESTDTIGTEAGRVDVSVGDEVGFRIRYTEPNVEFDWTIRVPTIPPDAEGEELLRMEDELWAKQEAEQERLTDEYERPKIEWLDWVASLSVGDVIEADCQFGGFALHSRDGRERVLIQITDCKLVGEG